jgi:hypothetical protein
MHFKFQIEQIALYPRDPEAARQLLTDMGAVDWVEDHVTATGHVFFGPATNAADLAFNYDMIAPIPRELEILHYTAGANWLSGAAGPLVSHFGMHCTEEDLAQWRRFFAERHIGVVQEMGTTAHTNPDIPEGRRYHYVIFATRRILGVDLKFIVRKDIVVQP